MQRLADKGCLKKASPEMRRSCWRRILKGGICESERLDGVRSPDHHIYCRNFVDGCIGRLVETTRTRWKFRENGIQTKNYVEPQLTWEKHKIGEA